MRVPSCRVLTNRASLITGTTINCVRVSAYPTAAEFQAAIANGWGGLYVVRAATQTATSAACPFSGHLTTETVDTPGGDGTGRELPRD